MLWWRNRDKFPLFFLLLGLLLLLKINFNYCYSSYYSRVSRFPSTSLWRLIYLFLASIILYPLIFVRALLSSAQSWHFDLFWFKIFEHLQFSHCCYDFRVHMPWHFLFHSTFWVISSCFYILYIYMHFNVFIDFFNVNKSLVLEQMFTRTSANRFRQTFTIIDIFCLYRLL